MPGTTLSASDPSVASSTTALRAAAHASADGTVRTAYSGTASQLLAPASIALTAPDVLAPGALFGAGGAVLGAINVADAATMSSLSAATLTAGAVKVGALESDDAAADQLTVTASRIRIDADVVVDGGVDTVAAAELSVVDTTLELGGVVADDPDLAAAVHDVERDGAGIVVAGAPQGLPADADAGQYEHSLRWLAGGGDFTEAGTPQLAQRRPVWDARGGGISMAAPDVGDRVARFSFVPTFTASQAKLDMIYTAGGVSTLMAAFVTTPLPKPDYEVMAAAPGVTYDLVSDTLTFEVQGSPVRLMAPSLALTLLSASSLVGAQIGLGRRPDGEVYVWDGDGPAPLEATVENVAPGGGLALVVPEA